MSLIDLWHDAELMLCRAHLAEHDDDQRACASLALIHAVSAIEHALLSFHDARQFGGKPTLGRMLRHAKNVIPWVNYSGILSAVTRRNETVHAGRKVDADEAARYLAFCRAQLEAWGVG